MGAKTRSQKATSRVSLKREQGLDSIVVRRLRARHIFLCRPPYVSSHQRESALRAIAKADGTKKASGTAFYEFCLPVNM